MEYRQLGRSGLRVSTITLGTMGFGGTGWASPVGRIDVDGARRQIDMCRDAGVNLIDTADVYSAGLSEEILGQALGKDRDDVLVATKVRGDMGPGPNDGGLSRHHVVRACEASLRRLGTDHIDLYQVHEWDGLTPLEETLSALDALVQSGKVRYIGSSNYTARQLMKSLWISDRDGLESFVSEQIYYSLQARDAENELIPIAVDEGLGVLVWSPLAGGLLSGKYRRGQDAPEGTRRFEGWTEPPVHDEDRLYDTVEVLVELAEGHGVSAAQVALAYTLGKPAVTSVIVGARTEEQLADNLAAAELTLSEDEVRRLDDVSGVPLLYPYWHQANTAVGRLNAADLSLLGRHLASAD
jgi:aryl-alcohol dehydrogenase-like predicted oxidoreductase